MTLRRIGVGLAFLGLTGGAVHLTGLAGTGVLQAQQAPGAVTIQSAFEAGMYDEALRKIDASRAAGTAAPADTYLAILAALKSGDRTRATAEVDRLSAATVAGWTPIAESVRAQMAKNPTLALEAAQRAVKANPKLFYALYQEGLARADALDWQAAAATFDRASQMEPMFAYAHYYAGYSYSQIRRADRTGVFFATFLKLAPQAPERPAVEAIMRTLRGR